ncbi:ENTH-domain-containing protein [Basidiobolus meristosporus CBS 931.73]|uniref:ENTH-domain-containing protein n=1 Tax=Basidiobolus meristosporus CBS 931.73 TaxID=1314790 RepID=A0A1Y1YPL5_9FUNG|nr:ENTH-domain-containing protein [Basidiobolus meristosporus CBS 931.73]|eukprot:ORX99773.1 ENTH-domain-containing protein [Basidiobolus meristosporus CBS 931.73]
MSKYMAKGALRSVKNMTRGYSEIQAKVREATSNDPWGPSGSQMSEIARATFDPHYFQEIMDMIDRRLNDKGKNWRHVFKALTLLDYCLHSGSQNVVAYAKDNFYIVKTLKEFQFIDEQGKDQGANVRQKAKDITALLADESRLKEERNNRSTMQNRMGSGAPGNDLSRYGTYPPRGSSFDPEEYYQNDEDRELQRAIEESKRSAAEYDKRVHNNDDDIQKAIELSKKEASEQSAKVSETNELVLLNDIPGTPSGANLYQQPQQYDMYGNIINQPSQNNNSFDPFDPLQSQAGSNGYNNGFQSQQAFSSSNNPFGMPQNPNQSFNAVGFQSQSSYTQNQTSMYGNNGSSFGTQSPSIGYNQQMPQHSPNPFQQQTAPAMGNNDPFGSLGGYGSSSPYGGMQQQPSQPATNNLIDIGPTETTSNAHFGSTASKNPFAPSGSQTWGPSSTKPSLNDIMRQQQQSSPFMNQQQQSSPFMNQPNLNGGMSNAYNNGYQPYQQQQQQQQHQQPYGGGLNNNNNPFGF